MAGESLDDELAGPYIFHFDIFNNEMNVVMESYRQARFKARFGMYKKERRQRTGKNMTATDEARMRKDEKTMAVLNAEPYSVQLDVVAQVVTYYMLAARRFHDSICMRIGSKFFKQLRTQLKDELENGLGVNDEDEGMRHPPFPLPVLIFFQATRTPANFSLSSHIVCVSARSWSRR
jgi:hypothetical protein